MSVRACVCVCVCVRARARAHAHVHVCALKPIVSMADFQVLGVHAHIYRCMYTDYTDPSLILNAGLNLCLYNMKILAQLWVQASCYMI